MDDLAFYATAAQVIPVLLIAAIFEAGAHDLRRAAEIDIRVTAPEQRSDESPEEFFKRFASHQKVIAEKQLDLGQERVYMYVLYTVVLVIGEALSLMVLAFDAPSSGMRTIVLVALLVGVGVLAVNIVRAAFQRVMG